MDTTFKVDSLVSVLPNHFGDNAKEERCFGTILGLTKDSKACVKWFEVDCVSIEDISILNLETEVPKKQRDQSLN